MFAVSLLLVLILLSHALSLAVVLVVFDFSRGVGNRTAIDYPTAL